MADPVTVNLEIDGMSCASCAGRAERALTALPGVQGVAVNFAAGTARMEMTGADLGDVTGALKAANYPAREATVSLTVQDLNCASCVGKAEDALATVPGVLAANGQPGEPPCRGQVPGGHDRRP